MSQAIQSGSATTPYAAATPGELTRMRSALLVAGCALGICFNIATVFNGTFTTFLKPISQETSWTRAEVSLGLSVAMVPLLLLLPWVGRLSDRIGPRRVIAAGAPLFSLALLAVAWAPPNYPLFLACCALMGMAAAASYNSLYYALLPHFFNRRLGLAVGIVSAGTGLGLTLGPLASQELISSLGWRNAYAVLAIVTPVVVVPTSLLLLRDPQKATSGQKPIGLSAASALRSPRFWRIVSTYFLTGLAINGTIVHLVPLLTDQGMSGGQAALLVAYLGAGVLVARIVSGVLLDYVDAGLLGSGSFLLAAGGIALLAFPQSESIAAVAVILIGCALGAEGGILSYVTRRVFGLQAYGTIIGSMMAGFLAGVLIGPFVCGAAFDVTGSYRIALLVFSGLCVLAAALHSTVTLAERSDAR